MPPKASAKTSVTSKAKIPKAIKQLVWNFYVGEDVGRTECFCCGVTKVTQLNFVCGHVLAEANGGKVTVDNLRPVCSMCNSSMATKNMIDFMNHHQLKGKAATTASIKIKPEEDKVETVYEEDKLEAEAEEKEDDPLPPLLFKPERLTLKSLETKNDLSTKQIDKFELVRQYVINNWETEFKHQKPDNISKETFIFFKSRSYNLCKKLGIF
jgi:hypothetical protein